MKKLQDYIHLYIGCKIILPGGGDYLRLVGVTESESESEPGRTIAICKLDPPPYDNQVFVEWYIEEVKLVLRPMDSITDEEAHECFHNIGGGPYAVTNPKAAFRGTHWVDFNIFQLNLMTAWLLKKGFDLFGLIEAGLAVKQEG